MHAAAQLPDPTLRIGVDNLPATGTDRFHTTRDSMTMKRIGISQEWRSTDKRAARQAAADASVGLETVRVQAAAADTRRQTALAYVDAFYVGESLKLARLMEHHAHEEWEASRARLSSAAGSSQDVLALAGARGVSADETADLLQQQAVKMPAGYAVSWSGQFEYLERATERLKLVVPATLAVIFVLLYVLFRSFADAALVMAAVPFSLVGGFWLIWALGRSISVTTAVGFIALAGVAAEFGVVMLILKNALALRLNAGEPVNEDTLLAAIREGAVLRVWPKAMTVAVVMAGLLPILWGSGTGSEVMTRIAAPMVGGMVTAPLLSMLVVPAAWYLLRRRGHTAHARLPVVSIQPIEGVISASDLRG